VIFNDQGFPFDNDNAALLKMFVAEQFRRKEHGVVTKRLLHDLLTGQPRSASQTST
jgi:hypothetical protein